MDDGELVGSPDSEYNQEDEAGEIDGAASAEAGVTTNVDHADVGEPHCEGEEDLGVQEVRRADGLLGDERAYEEAGGHAGEAEEEGLEGYLVGCLKRWQPGCSRGSGLGFETAFLHEIQERGKQGEREGSVGGEQECDVEEDPAGVELRKGGCLLAWTEGRNEAKKEAYGKDEDPERDGSISPVDQQKGQGQEEAEEGLALVGVDGKAMMGGDEHLGQRDEVEEECGDRGRNGDVAPAGTVVERCREDGQRGNAVEKYRDSEPEERHSIGFVRFVAANLQYIGYEGAALTPRQFRRSGEHRREYGILAILLWGLRRQLRLRLRR